VTKLTLREYLEQVGVDSGVVAWYTAIGTPLGASLLCGHPDMDAVERWGLYDLEGATDDDPKGENWEWDGEGNPRDDNGNSLTRVNASVDRELWLRLEREYNESF
jgi:hypothetical protein